MHLSHLRALPLFLAMLACLLSAVDAYAMKFYSDNNCQNYIGEDDGPNDEQSLALSFIECSNSPSNGYIGGARSFKMWNEPCTLARVQFGGTRSFSQECGMFYCQWGYIRTSAYGDHSACYSYNNEEITGWWVIYNYSKCRKRGDFDLVDGNSTAVVDSRDVDEYADRVIQARQQQSCN